MVIPPSYGGFHPSDDREKEHGKVVLRLFMMRCKRRKGTVLLLNGQGRTVEREKRSSPDLQDTNGASATFYSFCY